MLATILNIPYVAWARKLSLRRGGKLTVERLLDHGYDAVETSLPALVTVVKEINEPRVPSFKAKLKAKKEAIPVWGIDDLGMAAADVGLSGSFTQVVKVFPPPARGKSEIWTGAPEELAARLWQRLKDAKQGAIVGGHRCVPPQKGGHYRSRPLAKNLCGGRRWVAARISQAPSDWEHVR